MNTSDKIKASIDNIENLKIECHLKLYPSHDIILLEKNLGILFAKPRSELPQIKDKIIYGKNGTKEQNNLYLNNLISKTIEMQELINHKLTQYIDDVKI
ncbi:unnamed protein product [Gordionus sp. m RMFG-2023]